MCFDLRSPFTYFATQRLTILHDAGAKVRLRPVSIDGLLNLQAGREVWANYVDPLPPPKRAHLMQDIPRMADFWNIPLSWPPSFRPDSRRAMCLASLEDVGAKELHQLLEFGSSALWRDGHDLTEPNIFDRMLTITNISHFDHNLESEGLKILERNTKDAYENGVFGVPSFIVGDRVYFGADRMEMLADLVRQGTA
ncbi:DsbA family protein [Pseudaestuariivita rosea]|uniref:DsbA family protein n=1 Tax=Pseudaestuariivita rosea TaxID=2763263 RepID=UPI001F014C22|nr:DsbA family protein [Pseudaestuariivita rosea]